MTEAVDMELSPEDYSWLLGQVVKTCRNKQKRIQRHNERPVADAVRQREMLASKTRSLRRAREIEVKLVAKLIKLGRPELIEKPKPPRVLPPGDRPSEREWIEPEDAHA